MVAIGAVAIGKWSLGRQWSTASCASSGPSGGTAAARTLTHQFRRNLRTRRNTASRSIDANTSSYKSPLYAEAAAHFPESKSVVPECWLGDLPLSGRNHCRKAARWCQRGGGARLAPVHPEKLQVVTRGIDLDKMPSSACKTGTSRRTPPNKPRPQRCSLRRQRCSRMAIRHLPRSSDFASE